MGWWKMKDSTGMICHKEEVDNGMVGGDGPADVFGDAVDEIIEMYKTSCNRNPYKKEIRAMLEFVIRPMDLKEEP